MKSLRLLIGWVLLALGVSAANYVPNSSFELGVTRGWWYYSGSSPSVAEDVAPCQMMTNDCFHGTYSFRWPGAGYLYSRSFWLTAGTYTMSFYTKARVAGATFGYTLVPLGSIASPSWTTLTTTTTWARYNHSYTTATNGLFICRFYCTGSPTTFPELDAVQVESGGSATAYAPLSEVEFALDTAITNGVYCTGDAKEFQIKTYNNGGATATNSVMTSVYDTFNNVLGTNYTVVTAGVGNTTNTLALPAHTGWMDIIGRSLNHDSLDELTVSVLPFIEDTSGDTNLLLGTHTHESTYFAAKYRKQGNGWFRTLHPAVALTRWDYIETPHDTWNYDDAGVTRVVNAGLEIFGCLATLDHLHWPAWATNAPLGIPDFTNYAGRLAQRYGSLGTDQIHYWEVLNEPQEYTGTFAIEANYTNILVQTCLALKAADPACHIFAMAGQDDEVWAQTVWGLLTAPQKAMIEGVSCHRYTWYVADPNATDYNSFWHDWIDVFTGICPVWYNEGGVLGAPSYKGLNGLFIYNYDLYGTPTYECQRGERYYRLPYSIDRWNDAITRALGEGMTQVDFYDASYFVQQDATDDAGQLTLEEPNDTVKPHAATQAIMQYLINGGTASRRITVGGSANVEAYSWSTPLVAIWNNDRALRTLTLTNSNWGLLDYMGNVIQTNSLTLPITRSLRYMVSSLVTEAQFRQMVANATVAPGVDNQAPKVVFYIAPTGNYVTGDPMTLCRWDSVDNFRFNYSGVAAERTNVVYKWKLDSGSYSAFSASNHVWLSSSMANGNHVLYVTAQDAGGNSAEYTYEFAPEPSPPLPPGSTKVIRATTGKVGQITTP